jgi:flagellar basal-body rod modification protein FlgD
MAVTPITGVTSTPVTNTGTDTLDSGTAGAATANTMLDRDAFLKLLVAQLKYQDPSKPVDPSEMISQSASLSVVDKLDQISTVLSEAGATNRLSLGGSIIGKQITFAGPDGYLVTQLVSAVSFDGTSMVLRAGDWDVPIDSVKSIAAAPAAPTASSSTN